MLERRIVAVYTSREDSSGLSVVLGATSFDDLVNRLEVSQQAAQEDARIVTQVRGLSESLERRTASLQKAERTQLTLVAQRRTQRSEITREVAQMNAKLASVRDEITKMRAAEARRQELLRQQAEARLRAYRERQRQLQEQAQEQAAAAPAPTATGSTDEAPMEATSAAPSSSSTTPAATPPPPASSSGSLPHSKVGAAVVQAAMRELGVPYRWGGASPQTGFDCSGLVMYAYQQVGISLPHYTGSQWAMGIAVPRDQLEPGDVVFFNNIGHDGIYIGGNQFIEAPQTGDVVKISSITGWYAERYDGARRFGT